MTNQISQAPAESIASPTHYLSRRRKAAMIVQMMLARGRNISLKDLPQDAQLGLTKELSALKIVDRSTMNAVAEEFADILEQIGMTSPGTLDGAVDALAGTISPQAAERLRNEEVERRVALNPWAQIMRLDVEDLIPIMQDESTEVAAVVLSKLAVDTAAKLLGKIPGDRAREITFAVNQTRDIQPGAVARIGQAIARTHCIKPRPAFEVDAPTRIGAILDNSAAQLRDGVLDGLDTQDPEFASEVRKNIFTFADISTRLRALDVPNLVRAVNPDSMTTGITFALSLGGAEAEAAEFILGNMSQRMADQMREDIGERGKIRKSDGEGAMKAVTTAIRYAADAGEIELVDRDEDNTEDDDG